MRTIFKITLFSCICCYWSSCVLDKQLNCRSGSFNETISEHDFTSLPFTELNATINDQTVYFTYTSLGNVKFRYGKLFHEICPKVPAKVTFEIRTTADPQPILIHLTGVIESTHVTQTSSSSSTLFHHLEHSPITPSVIVKDSIEVDFTDFFDETALEVSVQMEVSFQALNSFQLDSLYFVQHIESIFITFEADRY